MSKTAVSLILNERPGSRLSQEAVERVRTAAAELGYRPNPAAQSLRSGKTRSIGFISDQVTVTRYASGMIRGVLAAAQQHDHTVLIAETGDDSGRIPELVEAMIDRRVDGLIIGLMVARMIDVPNPTHGIPLVIVNGSTPTDLPNVLPDEYSAGHDVAAELLAAGHRRIGVIGDLTGSGDPRRSVSIANRFAGIRDALREARTTPVHIEVDAWHPAVGHRECRAMMSAHPDLTAIIAGNDNMAFGIYQALGELGIRIPDDVSVISFDDDELAGYLRPGLTSARLPYEEMARRGVEMLLGDREPANELIPMPVVHRNSVRSSTGSPSVVEIP